LIHYIWMFVVGIVVGLIARFIMPGAEHMGLIMTGILGIVGSFVGGFIARLFSASPPRARRSTRPESSCPSSAHSSCCLSTARWADPLSGSAVAASRDVATARPQARDHSATKRPAARAAALRSQAFRGVVGCAPPDGPVSRGAPVAQLDRAPGYEPGGREFESLRARQFPKK
jgi:uncharacterized membrane protein YeaQ/YmgE (transglycosylase-associated protein family)